MRFPSLIEFAWAGMTIFLMFQTMKAPNETAKAVYILCVVISLATISLLRAINEK